MGLLHAAFLLCGTAAHININMYVDANRLVCYMPLTRATANSVKGAICIRILNILVYCQGLYFKVTRQIVCIYDHAARL